MIAPEYQDRVLEKNDLKKFIEVLLDAYRIFGPVKTACGEEFLEVKEPHLLRLDYQNTHRSPKHLFFPQTETLFYFASHGDTHHTKGRDNPSPDSSSILLGVRPCDAAAISCLDAVFEGNDYHDPYYTQKRDNTVIIGLSCTHPAATCFCTSVDCGPDSPAGADMLWFDLPERYFIQVMTQKGEEIIQRAHTLFRRSTLQDEEGKEEVVKNARQEISKIFNVDGLVKKIDNFDASCWERIHDKCLGCGICTYFCPTCHCFDITDDCSGSRGRRIRTWDSCMFPSFTQHASGHNPRPTQKERMRQRIMHKFNYAMKNNKCLFCVGCGRCIAHCPVNLDVRYILSSILGGS